MKRIGLHGMYMLLNQAAQTVITLLIRITESGDTRVAEDGTTRSPEQ